MWVCLSILDSTLIFASGQGIKGGRKEERGNLQTVHMADEATNEENLLLIILLAGVSVVLMFPLATFTSQLLIAGWVEVQLPFSPIKQ